MLQLVLMVEHSCKLLHVPSVYAATEGSTTKQQLTMLPLAAVHSYWGRRAFERHFKESRHQNGMKAMGIPNTKDFFEVGALEVWLQSPSLFLSLARQSCCVCLVAWFVPSFDHDPLLLFTWQRHPPSHTM